MATAVHLDTRRHPAGPRGVSGSEFCVPSLDFSREVWEKHGVIDGLFLAAFPNIKAQSR